ncbi:MAG TPA: 5'-methylthioadenosine/S-adenosylhomocysteine nucleosidase [Chitinophagaceae bacterium]|nr:5'-methylthioadenosine/S-adenosylhomocysteine nucleosidase [Chitinophagaceae bacterium]
MPKGNNVKPPCAVILTAIPLEYQAVKKHLVSLEEKTHPKGNVYEQGVFNGDYHDWEVGIAEVGPGNNTCAMQTERAINYFNPEVILFVGIAGGIKDLNLGDVVAAEKAYGYESGKISKSGFLTRPVVGMSSYEIFERAKADAKKQDWKLRLPKGHRKKKLKVITKPIAAGEKVVAEVRSEVYDLIYNSYNDTVAVEMEGSGFYTACHANGNIQFLIIRGISDLLSNKSETDAQGYQEIAARNASAFAFEVLSKYKIR